MGVLRTADRERVRLRLASLPSPVKLVHFTQDRGGICTDEASCRAMGPMHFSYNVTFQRTW